MGNAYTIHHINLIVNSKTDLFAPLLQKPSVCLAVYDNQKDLGVVQKTQHFDWRRERESNPRMSVLQTEALPLRHHADWRHRTINTPEYGTITLLRLF